MENNFIQLAASARHAVAYTNGPIFKHIIDCVQLNFTNGFTNNVLAFRILKMNVRSVDVWLTISIVKSTESVTQVLKYI